ncbi:DUF4185 domain-containing protein [Mucilaginibacter limnophilus]|uniref:DUF4185 domain-containing protein n=1 Tax=Mucilaginibacter limnophilus TaxID=1932778 RepID=A0A3S2Y2N1_9SPHI|nr:DUF4185 domain-containing protein [Mucilaginibacter limnophilus]RVU02040.1 DUF4185 domain-containing protein [Mucilaginibacter limnophilus]
MNNQVKLLKNAALIAGLAFLACSTKNSTAQTETVNTDTVNIKYTVEEAPEWTNLFIRQSGWFGSDGIYAIPQDGKRYNSPNAKSNNMFIFSDTMIGEIVNGELKERKMVNNTVAYIKGSEPKKENITFYWDKDAAGKPKSMFIPNTPSTKPGDYYWLGDAYYNPVLKNTYIIAYRMHTMDPKDDWSFREMGTNLIIIPKGSKPPFKDQRQVETPLHFDTHENGGFGAGIFVNTKEAGAPKPDGYVYIYGNGGLKGKGLLAARVLEKDFENFSAWRFYNGKEWVADMKESAALTTNVSNELSVSPLPDGRYALVFELGGMGTTVAMRIGLSPVGPWGPVKELYHSKPANSKFIHYNAKAHPSLSAPGELLVSYNQNSWDFHEQLAKFPNLYHPFFLKVKFE